jgi:hypothetical protein
LSSAFCFEGPLQVKNQYPIFLHADQQYLEKAAMENSMSFSLSHSSTYTVQESGHWTINLDMEITELNFRYKRIIKDVVEFSIDVPVLSLQDGFMDGFLETYHDAFGFSDYGRSERPHNEFLYEVKQDGKLMVKGETGVRLGDIRIALKKPLMSSDGFNLSIRGDIEIPVSSAEKGYSNGSLDAGVAVLLDKRITERLMAYFNVGGVFTGDVKGYNTVELDNFIYGGAALEAGFWENVSLLAQLQGQSSIYPQTDLGAVDDNAWMLAVGFRYKKGTRSCELSLTEDINTSGAPDFIVNFTYQVNM